MIPPKGYIMDDQGRLLRLPGKLVTTEDGVVIEIHTESFVIYRVDYTLDIDRRWTGNTESCLLRYSMEDGDEPPYHGDIWYSTREAAEAFRDKLLAERRRNCGTETS